MIQTNTKIDNYLKQKIIDNDLEITFDELKELGIIHNENDFEINENVYFRSIYMLKAYKLMFKDKRKDYNSKILDEYIVKKDILNAVSDYTIDDKKYKQFKNNRQAEVEWNKDLEKYLRNYFVNVKRGNPAKSIEIDIDLGNGMAGLELKWADKINKNNPMNAVIGQIDGYYRNGNYKNLFLLVAGKESLKQDTLLNQLEKRIKSIYDCDFIFIKIE